MRELALLETGYLACGLVLCLVLPLMMSFRGPQDRAARRLVMKTVWLAQVILAVAGLTVLASRPFAPYAAAFGLVSCIACTLIMRRQLRAARAA